MSIKAMVFYLDKSPLTGNDKLALIILADYCSDEGECFPGHKRIAQRLNMTISGARKLLYRLRDQGEIEILESEGVQTKSGSTNRYRLLRYIDSLQTVPVGTVSQEGQSPRVSPAGQGRVSPVKDTDPSVVTPSKERGAIAPTPPVHRPHVAADSFDMVGTPTTPQPLQKHYVPAQSRHITDSRKFSGGYIPAGTGATPVEVYYESFSVREKEERLTEPQQDDLAKACPDLAKLRAVCVAYRQMPYKARNIKLILDWYNKGIKTQSGHDQTATGGWNGLKTNIPDYMQRIMSK